MERERYPGERRGLARFLTDLLPAVEGLLGPDALLLHSARRALRAGDLRSLRNARRMFNAQSREVKQALSDAICARPGLAEEAGPSSADFVCFEGENHMPSASLRSIDETALDDEERGDVLVRIRAGTLPSAAAKRLREMAAAIENDRRLLSARHWRRPTGEGA